MKTLGDVAQQVYSNSYGKKNFSSSIAIEEKLSKEEEDKILDSFPQLIDEKFRGWYTIRLRERGKRQFVQIADRAIKYGRNPQKMFAHLIK